MCSQNKLEQMRETPFCRPLVQVPEIDDMSTTHAIAATCWPHTVLRAQGRRCTNFAHLLVEQATMALVIDKLVKIYSGLASNEHVDH